MNKNRQCRSGSTGEARGRWPHGCWPKNWNARPIKSRFYRPSFGFCKIKVPQNGRFPAQDADKPPCKIWRRYSFILGGEIRNCTNTQKTNKQTVNDISTPLLSAGVDNNTTVLCNGLAFVSMSVCLSRRHTHNDWPGSSIRRGQRTFRPDNKADGNTC